MAAKRPPPPALRRTPNQTSAVVKRHVGQRVRESRNLIGMSLAEASKRTGVSAQQFNRYENGQNDMGLSVLVRWMRVCGKPANFFLNDVPLVEEDVIQAPDHTRKGHIVRDAYDISELLHKLEPETRQKLRWFLKDVLRLAKKAEKAGAEPEAE